MGRGRWLGLACGLGAALGFSWKAILAKLAYRTGVDATTVLGLRMAFALPAYLGMAFVGMRQRPSVLALRDWLHLAVLGVLGYYLSSYLDFIGLTRISAGLERLILFLYPSIVLVMAALRDRRAIRRQELSALALGYTGIACVFMSDFGEAPIAAGARLGALSVFAGSLVYSGYLVFSETLLARLGSLLFTGLALSFSCVFSLLHFALTNRDVVHLPGRAVQLCAAMALFSTVLPTWLLSEAIRRIGSSTAAQCGMIGPVMTVGLEVVLLGETAGWPELVGTALVLVSVALATRAKRHQ